MTAHAADFVILEKYSSSLRILIAACEPYTRYAANGTACEADAPTLYMVGQTRAPQLRMRTAPIPLGLISRHHEGVLGARHVWEMPFAFVPVGSAEKLTAPIRAALASDRAPKLAITLVKLHFRPIHVPFRADT